MLRYQPYMQGCLLPHVGLCCTVASLRFLVAGTCSSSTTWLFETVSKACQSSLLDLLQALRVYGVCAQTLTSTINCVIWQRTEHPLCSAGSQRSGCVFPHIPFDANVSSCKLSVLRISPKHLSSGMPCHVQLPARGSLLQHDLDLLLYMQEHSRMMYMLSMRRP